MVSPTAQPGGVRRGMAMLGDALCGAAIHGLSTAVSAFCVLTEADRFMARLGSVGMAALGPAR